MGMSRFFSSWKVTGGDDNDAPALYHGTVPFFSADNPSETVSRSCGVSEGLSAEKNGQGKSKAQAGPTAKNHPEKKSQLASTPIRCTRNNPVNSLNK